MRALVVEDAAAEHGMLAHHLTKLGLEVERTPNSQHIVTQSPVWRDLAIILLDWNVPGGEGLDMLRRVRAERVLDAVPVIVVTTASRLAEVAQALQAGANEYLLHPFESQGVLEKLLLLGVDPEQRRAA